MTKVAKTQLEKDIDKIVNSGNAPWRVIYALAIAYENKGMLPVARKLMGIVKWLTEDRG